MLSAQVRTMLEGYGNHATQLGYQKKGAVPLIEVEMQLLLQSIHKTCNSSSTYPHQHMLLMRDGMLFSLLWQSCLRGFNAGALRLDNVVLPTGVNIVPYQVPELRVPELRLHVGAVYAGAVLHLLSDTTKNKKGGHCKITLTRCDVLLHLVPDSRPHHAAAGQPFTNYITSPLPTTSPAHWEWEPSSLL